MKVAIVGSFNFHLECIGFLLEINNNDDIDIYLEKRSDKYNWLEHYLSIYHFQVIYDNFHRDIMNNYDKVFKLSPNDKCLNDKKIISILHKHGGRGESEKFISLTPYVTGNNIYYMFPIYRPILIDNSKLSKNVILIGHYTNNDFDNDTIQFINNNINYNFNFILWGSNSYPNLYNLKNVKVLSNVKANDMIKLINNSKFILSKKKIKYDRLSGQLALAISFEKPLIVDVKTKTTYNLPSIVFNKNYSEVGNLDDVSDEKYDSLINEIKSLKNNIIDNNKKTLKLML